MHPLTFAIVTPSFNQGRFLRDAVESVLGQLPTPGAPPFLVEYMVVDGGSNDETLDVLREYASRLRYLSEPDRGQAHAVNKGVAMTSGEIIGWLNSDDYYLPGAFAAVAKAFHDNPETMVVYGGGVDVDETGARLQEYPVEDWNYARLHELCYLSQPAVFFRREMVERYGGPDETLTYTLDYELWLRWGERVPFLRIPQPLAATRIYAATKTHGARLAVHEEHCAMFASRLGRAPRKWLHACAYYRLRRHDSDRVRRLTQTPWRPAYWPLWMRETMRVHRQYAGRPTLGDAQAAVVKLLKQINAWRRGRMET